MNRLALLASFALLIGCTDSSSDDPSSPSCSGDECAQGGESGDDDGDDGPGSGGADPGTGGSLDNPTGGDSSLGGEPGAGGVQGDPRCDWIPHCKNLDGGCFEQFVECGELQAVSYECGNPEEKREGYAAMKDMEPVVYPCSGSADAIACTSADEDWSDFCAMQ